jgi:gas vesicle protein
MKMFVRISRRWMSRHNSNDQVLAFFSGIVLGAVAVLLFTPEPGPQLRRRAMRYARETGEELAERSAELIEKGRQTAEAALQRGQEVIESGKEVVKDVADKVREAVDKTKDAVKGTAGNT